MIKALVSGAVRGGVLSAVAAAAGLYFLGAYRFDRFDESWIAPAGRAASVIQRSFSDLEAIDLPPCSPEHLAAMRSVIFRTPILRDVAYGGDEDTYCTGVLGTIEAPRLAFGRPDFVASGKTELWLRRTVATAPGLRTTVLQRGKYVLLVVPANHPLKTPFGSALSSVLVNRETGATLPFQGPDARYPAAMLVDGSRFYDGPRLVSVGCIASGSLCYVMALDPLEVIKRRSLTFALLIALGISSGALFGLLAAMLRRRRSSLPSRLRAAIAARDLILEYQPIIDIASRRIVGAEALMRWKLRNGENIPPSEFIPAIETSPLVTALDCLAIEMLADDLGDLLRSRGDLVVSVNAGARDLADPRFFAALDRHIVGTGIPTGSIAIEITERQAIDMDVVVAATRWLHDAGYRIYLDDFGTGYSNISYLGTIDIDFIKLDKRFTQAIGTDLIRTRLTSTILELGMDLSIPYIAEGIEREEQEEFYRAAGVQLGQGWLYSRSMSAGEFIAAASSGDAAGRVSP